LGIFKDKEKNLIDHLLLLKISEVMYVWFLIVFHPIVSIILLKKFTPKSE